MSKHVAPKRNEYETEHFRYITFHKNVKAETNPVTGEVTLILPASPMPESAIEHIKGLATILRIPIRVIEEMVDEQCLFQLFKDHQK